MNRRLRRSLQITVLAIVILSAVLLAGIASAQQSTNYELGCWGVATSGGGTRNSSNFRLTDMLGQWYGLDNVSELSVPGGNFKLRPGYAQNLAFPSRVVTTTSITAPTQAITLYMPFVNSYIRVVYQCPQ